MSEPATIKYDIVWGKDLPNQLEIRKGVIVMIQSGQPATFDMPEGTHVNVVVHDDIVKTVDAYQLLRGWGA